MPDEIVRQDGGGVLLALAKQCEEASGPDRNLDLQIERDVIGHVPLHWRVGSMGTILSGFDDVSICVPLYTASLDVALKLVPEGCWVTLRFTAPKPSETYEGAFIDFGETPYHANCRRPEMALALCAAALKARAALATPPATGRETGE